MVVLFGSPEREADSSQSIIFVALLLPVLIAATYTVLYLLVPRYLLKGEIIRFIYYTCFTLVVTFWLESMIVIGLLMTVYEFQIELLNPRITDLSYLTGAMILVILPAVTMHITSQWYKERGRSDSLEKEKLEFELASRKRELDYLKEQMNPHFLFNVLNSLYGLTLEKSELAPELVLKVSGMLDYMLYKSSYSRVQLADELQNISDYLEIQKIRCGDKLTIQSNIKQLETRYEKSDYHMAPNLLLPFIENSFKHGVAASGDPSRVDIMLSIVNDRLEFDIRNTLPKVRFNSAETEAILDSSGRSGGVGLVNVRKRLDLIYGEDYELDITQSDGQFLVTGFIPMDTGLNGKSKGASSNVSSSNKGQKPDPLTDRNRKSLPGTEQDTGEGK